MEQLNQIERFINWLEQNVIIIIGVIAGIIYLMEFLEPIHFIIIIVLGITTYLVVVIQNRKKELEKQDVIIK